jgi:DNA-binding NarL/FixJ family response regulator
VNDCTQLRSRIETLRPNMSADEFERARREMLALIDGTTVARSSSDSDAPAPARLSRREHEVMTMMLSGQRLKEIAMRLNISVKTVTTHRARLMKKLRVEDNLGLYRYGIRAGLISV